MEKVATNVTIKKLLEFLQDDSRDVFHFQTGDGCVYTIVKMPKRPKNSLALYGIMSPLNSSFHTALKTFYFNRTTNKIYDLPREMQEYFSELSGGFLFEASEFLSNKISEKIYELIKNDEKRIEYNTENNIVGKVLDSRSILEQDFISRFTLFRLSYPSEIRIWTFDEYLDSENPEEYIEFKAKEKIANNKRKLYQGFANYEATKREIEKAKKDKTHILNKLRALKECAKGKTAVTITIGKDGKTLTCRVNTRCDIFDGSPSDWGLPEKSEREFRELFGRSPEIKAEEIIEVKYRGKVIYRRSDFENAEERTQEVV